MVAAGGGEDGDRDQYPQLASVLGAIQDDLGAEDFVVRKVVINVFGSGEVTYTAFEPGDDDGRVGYFEPGAIA